MLFSSHLRLTDPRLQITIISLSVFTCPGLYLAVTLQGAGGGDASSATTATIANSLLYGIFTIGALCGAGHALNVVGPRWMLLFGMSGYPIFQGSLWYYSKTGRQWFPLVAGAYLGLSASALWTTNLFVANAYAEEKDKGFWRSIQWVSFVIGSTIGSAVALGVSWDANSPRVPDAVYLAFIVLQLVGLSLVCFVRDPRSLRRSDGTALATFDHMSVAESAGTTFLLLKDWRILMLLPCMLISEMFFPLQASLNVYAFNLRTRTLNSLLNSLVQVPTCLLIGWLLDNDRLGSRRIRAMYAIAFDAVWVIGAYIAQTFWIDAWDFDRSAPGPGIDCADEAYAGAVLTYMLYAAQYGMLQSVIIYALGSFTNDPRKTAVGGGLYIRRSAGTAISFGIDAAKQPYQDINAALFVVKTLCWPLLALSMWFGTRDTNYLSESSVIAPRHVIDSLSPQHGDSLEAIHVTGES